MKQFRTILAACLAFGAAGAVADSASAQAAEQVAAARRALAHEPTVAETTRRALEYFRVHPEAIDGLRSSARGRALLPVIAAGYQYGQDRSQLFYDQQITEPQTRDQNAAGTSHAVSVGALWDLRQLVFNPAEVDAYGLVAVQRDVMLEITRTYFLRRQLQLRLALRPPDDPLAYAALELRVNEFAAILDTLTGGWFTETAAERREARAER
jgi:hypothetical protein